MSDKNFEKVIHELKQKLSLEFENFKGIYFYGSRIKGNFRPDSDYDIIVLFDNEYNLEVEYKLAGIIGEFEYIYEIFIDYHPYTLEELKRNPIFFDEVANKGIYYEAA